MKRITFYHCPVCGNVLTGTGGAEISCCGRRLAPLDVQPADEAHTPRLEEVETDWYLTFDHPMTKAHALRFVACATFDRVLLVHLYPEQEAAVRLPQMRGGTTFYIGCGQDGLFRWRP